jgi:hypothetical protein
VGWNLLQIGPVWTELLGSKALGRGALDRPNQILYQSNRWKRLKSADGQQNRMNLIPIVSTRDWGKQIIGIEFGDRSTEQRFDSMKFTGRGSFREAISCLILDAPFPHHSTAINTHYIRKPSACPLGSCPDARPSSRCLVAHNPIRVHPYCRPVSSVLSGQ